MVDDHRTGRVLQQATIAWNLAEVVVTVGLGIAAGSLALVAFGLDSLVEVFASLVVLWRLGGVGVDVHEPREPRAVRLVGVAFAVLAVYLAAASVRALVTRAVPDSSPLGIAYLAATAVVMFSLAALKRRVGRRLESRAFLAEARLTFLDGCLASTIMTALAVNALLGWWWADAIAGLVVSVVAARESYELVVDADADD